MNPLHLLATHHAIGAADWLMHSFASALVHALVYGLVFRMLHHLGLMQGLVLAAVALGLLFWWARTRDRQRGGW